jgi:hypothetical protein
MAFRLEPDELTYARTEGWSGFTTVRRAPNRASQGIDGNSSGSFNLGRIRIRTEIARH